MRYSVHIPGEGAESFDHTVTVDAPNWMTALRTALEEVGQSASEGLFADIKDDQVVKVLDPGRQAVYNIRLVSTEGEGTASDTLEMTPDERAALVKSLRGSVAQEPVSQPRVVDQQRSPSGEQPKLALDTELDESVIELVLEQIEWAWEKERSLQEVSGHILDLAIKLIPAESGAVLYPGLQGTDLYFSAARGPHAEAVMRFRLPIEQGIAGFCLREGVALAVRDVANDSRFYDVIARSLDYMPRNALCAPVKVENRVFGVIELLNANEGSFTMTDVSILAHMAQQLGQYINASL